MTATTVTTAPTRTVDRRRPALGGLSTTLLGIELRRLLRNRRTMIFTLVMPVAFFFMFGRSQPDPAAQRYVLVSLAVYGAMVAATAAGASVSVERAQGWSRQLRLTPLRPVAYIVLKAVVALAVAAVAVVVELGVGAAAGVHLGTGTLVLCGLAAWGGSAVFAAFGLFMGYLLPSENVMQVLGPVLGALSFLGGLFVPVSVFGHTMASIAKVTPVFGVGEVARSPLAGEPLTAAAVVNVLAWTALFVAGAVWRFRRDTART